MSKADELGRRLTVCKSGAIRLFAAALLMLAATSAIFAAGLPLQAAASPAAGNASGWSQGRLIDPLRGGPTSVSCPMASFCAAVDINGGNVLTYDGRSWSKPVSIDLGGDGLTSVSCPTASLCAAVDGIGNDLTYRGS